MKKIKSLRFSLATIFIIGLGFSACGGDSTKQPPSKQVDKIFGDSKKNNLPNQENNNNILNQQINQTTKLISNYMDIQYSKETTSLKENLKNIDAQLASRGMYMSGLRLQEHQKAYNNQVNDFTKIIKQYIINVNSNQTTSSIKIEKLINQYQTIWINKAKNHFESNFSGTSSSLIQQINNELSGSIKSEFYELKLDLQALSII